MVFQYLESICILWLICYVGQTSDKPSGSQEQPKLNGIHKIFEAVYSHHSNAGATIHLSDGGGGANERKMRNF